MNTKRKILIAAIAILGLGLLGVWVSLSLLNAGAQSRLDKAVAAAKRLGIWSESAAEFAETAPEAQNAAPIYQRHQHSFEKSPNVSVDLSRPADRLAMLAYLSEKETAMKELAGAAQLPRALFPHTYTNFATELFPELANFKAMVRAFSWRAELEARDGKVGPAIQDLVTAARIARHSGDGPTLIHLLVQVSGRSLVLRSLEHALTSCPRLADRAGEVLDAFGPRPDFVRAWRFEIAASRPSLAHPFNLGEMQPADSQSPRLHYIAWLSKFPWNRKNWTAKLLENAVALAPAFQANSISTWLRAARDSDVAAERNSSLEDEAVSQFSISMSGVVMAIDRDVAGERLARQAIAMIASHKYDRLALGGADAVDPYTDEPLKLKAIKGGFRVYAVGASGRDQGGTRVGEGGHSASDSDLTFDFPFVPVNRTNSGPGLAAPLQAA
jgi:hypothetical protein